MIVTGAKKRLYLPSMNLTEIEQEALALSDRERASLAAKLLDTLPPPGTDVSDEEVERREKQLESERLVKFRTRSLFVESSASVADEGGLRPGGSK